MCGITATPPNKDIQRTALGSTDSVQWEYAKDTISIVKKLQQQDVYVASIEQAEDAILLNNFTPPIGKKLAIIMGNEVKGVQQEVVSESNSCIEIPQYGTKHSLNISVTCGIVIWDLLGKIKN